MLLREGRIMRNHHCKNYDVCLDIAAKANFIFHCNKCDGETIVVAPKILKLKRGPGRPRSKDLSKGHIFLNFRKDKIAIYRELIEIAEKEGKLISRQAMVFVKEGIDRYKGLEKEE